MPAEKILRLSKALSGFADRVGKWGSIFILPLIMVTMWDVVVRKLGGFQIWMVENLGPPFESTIIQELEWHFHTALFVLVLGYGYVHNRHVRVDLVREKLSFRKQAWIEFLGCSLAMIPYCAIVTWFAIDYAYDAFVSNEISASMVGLPYRWIIKTVLVIGLIVAGIAGISVWLQTILVLFGPKDLRFDLMTLEWPEDMEAKRQLRANAEKAPEDNPGT